MINGISDFLYLLVFPILVFYFYCRFSSLKFTWHLGLIYSGMSFFAAYLEMSKLVPAIILLILRVLLPALCGILFTGQNSVRAFGISSLVVSVYHLTFGLIQSIEFCIAANLFYQKGRIGSFLQYMDLIGHTGEIFVLVSTFLYILRFFSEYLKDFGKKTLPLLTIPLLFISYVEQIISASVYGDTVIWDSSQGLIYPVVNHMDIITLYLLACLYMWSSLFILKKTVKSIDNEQTIRLMKLQAREQENYVKEAMARYEQTISFRHDIKNHLMVLKNLLADREWENAESYLSGLEHVSDSLSFPVHTNNTVVDVLLGSKLTAAVQNNIKVDCDFTVPPCDDLDDTDWCIILANAVDNAIAAGKMDEVSEKYLNINGKRKGNLFHLHIENGCRKDTKAPAYGIGLKNILTVVKKNKGTMDIEVHHGVFQLDILLVISHQ